MKMYTPSRRMVKNTTILVPLNKTSVTVLIGASTGIGRESNDFLPLYVATSILGYGFHGQLMRIVRMERGLTYGAYARLEPHLFYASATFARSNVEKGIDAMRDAMARWSDSITIEEVEIQKKRLLLTPVVLSDDSKIRVKAYHTFLNQMILLLTMKRGLQNQYTCHSD